jgi:hypothetical protein
MSAAEWTGETSELAKPPKKRVPTWIWACGGGCALVAVVGVLIAAFAFRFIKKAIDPDLQWAALSQHLQFEPPHPNLHIFGMPVKLEGMSMWMLTDTAGKQQATVLAAEASPKATETRNELFDATKEVSFMGLGRHDPEPGELEIQGRRLHCLRYTSLASDRKGGAMGKFMEQMQGASIVVDLAPEGSQELLAFILTRQGSSERIDDAAVVAFLAPFRIPGSNAPPIAPPAQTTTMPDEKR